MIDGIAKWILASDNDTREENDDDARGAEEDCLSTSSVVGSDKHEGAAAEDAGKEADFDGKHSEDSSSSSSRRNKKQSSVFGEGKRVKSSSLHAEEESWAGWKDDACVRDGLEIFKSEGGRTE